jgi:DNA-binding transcriptional LysR family regulator
MLPNLYDLKYFIELSQTLNISRAAERLGITQPSLSTALKRLEDSLGLALVIRNKNGIQLTNEGKSLEAQARELIKNWENLRSALHKDSATPSGRFILGSHSVIAQYCLPHFLPSLLKNYPKLEMNFIHDLSRKIVEKCISFEIDAGLVINPIKHPDLVLTLIGQDEVGFYTAPKCQNPQTLFCDMNLLQSQDLLRKGAKSGLHFDRIIESSSLDLIADATTQGLGVGLLPGRVAHKNPQSTLRLISQKAPRYKDTLYLIYRADHIKSVASKKIIQEIVSGLRASFR